MAGLRDTIASLVRNREQFSPLDAAFLPDRGSDQSAEAALKEVRSFGSNPGNLRMFDFIPADLRPGSALVVVLHGCTQDAAGYAEEAGWLALAASQRFALLLPEQRVINNPNSCWNWFRNLDIQRDSGEVCSIWQMVERTIVDHAIDRSKVYVTGLSAGGAMACALLATYPDVFAGGAILAGLPYRCTSNVQQAMVAMAQPRQIAPRALGDLVRSASLHRGPWPEVSIWHGTADRTVVPANADALARQWCDVHGLAEDAFDDDKVEAAHRRTWRNANGKIAVERIMIDGLAHATPIDPQGLTGEPLGSPAPFVVDARISSTRLIAARWALADMRVPRAAVMSPAGGNSLLATLKELARKMLAFLRRALPRRWRRA